MIQISNSMHASRSELIEFIQYLKPRKVVACVVPKKSSLDEVNFASFLFGALIF